MSACNEDNVLEELLRLLKLEKIEENIFRGQSQDLGFGSVFGWGKLYRPHIKPYNRIEKPTACMHIF